MRAMRSGRIRLFHNNNNSSNNNDDDDDVDNEDDAKFIANGVVDAGTKVDADVDVND